MHGVHRFVRMGARAPALRDVADDQLVLLLRARGTSAERALDELYARYSATVYAQARGIVRDKRTAEELLQETFWRVWRYAERYEPGRARFATWILHITHNLGRSEIRYESRRPRISEPCPDTAVPSECGASACSGANIHSIPDVPDTDLDVDEQVWRAERRRALAAGLAGLPAEQRQAVELAYLAGLTHLEIAARQAAPLSTVKTRLALGLRKLAAHLRSQRMGVEDEQAYTER